MGHSYTKRIATPEEIERMKAYREARTSWVDIAKEMGVGRDWCQRVGTVNGFGGPLKEPQAPVPTVDTSRAAAGHAPLREGHPLALAELARARSIVF
jgi:hypothetical protein